MKVTELSRRPTPERLLLDSLSVCIGS